ncbi:MAG: DNA topoisomerase III [Gammaproteobacteria bacterium]|nr:DNA topoisomerase III [Paracoccaceae bacterium]PCI65020.1 MAG: DNA topoisomerase III [Gammaproteobacteria bacterium]
MILYIAEKPSLGRALAEALPKPHKKQDGCIHLANGDVVSWCIGHLLEQAEPDAYDDAYKKWRLEHLPITPDVWKLVPKKQTRKQLTILRQLVKESTQIVHVGDPDREGQLLVDEVINYFKVSAKKKKTVQRCLISDLNLPAVTRALKTLRSNQEFIPLSTSALARSRADWLYGLNMTRLCTIQGSKAGYNGVLSVGRVQTPLLGLVVARDGEIENFISKAYYQVWAHLRTSNNEGQNETFKAKWLPSETCLPYQDDEGRVLSRSLAENVATRIKNQPATVLNYFQKRKQQPAPLPYNLSSLQIDAAKRYTMSAKQVLDTCQSLYEKHKLITYPRSDCRFLPIEHLKQANAVTSAIAFVCGQLSTAVLEADLSLVSKAWNDKKIQAHHAIIPTARKLDATRLNSFEANVYQLIARQYIIQFYPAYQFEEKQITLEIAGGHFIAKAKQPLKRGWKKLFEKKKYTHSSDEKSELEKSELQESLPSLNKDDVLTCEDASLLDKQTTPPKYFTDATLLAAMTGISRYVKEPEIRKILRETDGLGTEATRAGIIELLFNRQYLKRQGKQIVSTLIGRKLISSLPETATLPDMTAQWESQLSSISQSKMSYQDFMSGLLGQLNELIPLVDSSGFAALKGEGKRKTFKKKQYFKKKIKK